MTITDVDEQTESASGSGRLGGEATWAEGGHHRRRGRLLVALAIALVVALAITGGVWFLVYRATYQPLEPGYSAWGPVGADQILTDGVVQTEIALVGRPGEVGAEDYPLTNDGNHPVEILGLVPQDPPGLPLPSDVASIALRWSPVGPDGSLLLSGPQAFATSRVFPAHLGAHQQIEVWVAVTKPHCRGADETIDGVTIRWKALGLTHTRFLSFGPIGSFDPETGRPVLACYQTGSYGRLQISRP